VRISALSLAAIASLSFAAAANEPASVFALRETEPVGVAGDAADDPAIVPGATVEDTRVIGTQKKGGLYVYDLTGKVVQSIPGGRPNNVDMRAAFPWTDGAAPIVATSDRSDNTIALYRFDPATHQLEPIARTRIATGFKEVYGVTLGKHGADFVAVATSKTGDVAQWRLLPTPDGVEARRARTFALGSIAEGCVVDDETASLYVSQEEVGLWRFPLDPATGGKGQLLDTVGGEGNLAADVEGVTIWRGLGVSGYLVVSVQGESRFNVYDRELPNRYRGTFRIVDAPGGGIDGVSTTDGVDALNVALGPDFPHGILVVQDDANTRPKATQNFKYVSWADVERALNLTGTNASNR
jgi:3-phytase